MNIRLSRQWWRKMAKLEEGVTVSASPPAAFRANAPSKRRRRKPSKNGRAVARRKTAG